MLNLNSRWKSKKQYLSFSVATVVAAVFAFVVVSACTDNQAKAKLNIVTKDAPRPGVVAKIGGEEITEEMLIGEDRLDFLDLKKREYEMKMERLNRLVIEKLAGAEAKKANMELNEYIDKKVIGGEIKISEAEFKKFVKEKNVPESQLNPQLKERINAYLQQMKRQDKLQAYVAKLTAKTPVEVYFTKPKLQVDVDPGNSPWFGGENAKVTLVEFSDFQCPYCAQGADRLTALKKKYGNKIKVHFRHFPLPNHPQAKPAAEASMCVNEQSREKFWKYHDLVFKNQAQLDDANLEKYAKEVGADVAKFNECYKAKKYAQAVQADMEYGEKIGVRSTPTFFVNGQLISGAVPVEQFAEIIDEELAGK